MPDFYYEGFSREGEKIRGDIFADNETDLRVKLRAQRIRPVKIKERAVKENAWTAPAKTSTYKNPFSDDERIFFVKEMLVMLKAGLTLTQALEVLMSEGATKHMREFASTARNYMESGMTFSQALGRFPKYFDNLFLNLVASGELRGNLEYVMTEWLNYFKKEIEIKKTVSKTVIYPAAIAAIIFAAFIIVVAGIAPVFVHIYRTYNQPLPVSLVTITTFGSIIQENFIIIAAFVTLVVVGLIILSRSRLIHINLDSLILKTPGFSNFFKQVYALRAMSTMNLALKTGLSVTRALELASEKIGNHVFEECLLKAKEAVTKGEEMAPFFANSGLFKPMVVQVISIGEVMGQLPEMLSELMVHINEETKRISSVCSSIIEPLLLTLGGVLIGALLTSFFMPVFTLLTKIK